jgi:nicotinamide-nucleotide amidase
MQTKPELFRLANELIDVYKSRNLLFGCAESCTGGLMSSIITEVPGASDIFHCGIVSYANTAKNHFLDVSLATLKSHGAVSAEVAVEMAEGLLRKYPLIDTATSITGIAGPGGGTEEKPVGLVFIGAKAKGKMSKFERHVFPGNRAEIREAAAARAMQIAIDIAISLKK